MNENTKHKIFGLCIAIALFGAFIGGAAAATSYMEEIKFRGVVTGSPNFGGAVVTGAINVRISEIISDPTSNLTMGDTATVSWSIVPPFYDINVTVGDKVEVCGEYRNIDGIPDQWSDVGEHRVNLNASVHYLTVSDITFIGTAIEYFGASMPGASYGWNISVDEVIIGSVPCNNWLNVTLQAVAPPVGSMDQNIAAGDKVEVYGNYCKDPEGCSVSLVGSGDYYLVRILCVHNIATGEDFAGIQDAIDAPDTEEGDIIVVDAGTYYGTVVVTKSLTLHGEGLPTIDARGRGDAINITVDNCVVRGFRCVNASESGISFNASNIEIHDNTCWNNDVGILATSFNNTLARNYVSNNVIGISFKGSDCSLIDNRISNNSVIGIHLAYSHNNTIANNTFADDGLLVGVYRNSVKNNTVYGNTVNGKPLYYLEEVSDQIITDAGQVILVNCDNITVKNFDLSYTTVGIELFETRDSRILDTNVSNSYRGILLGYSSNNSLRGNDVSNNVFGISLVLSSGNMVYHNNLIYNTNQAIDDSGTNSWDNGYPCGGNYWSDYEEEYPGASEIGESGIWNVAYDISGGAAARDNYPLMQPWSPSKKGDLNGDNKITSADAVIALAIAASGKENYVADIDGDGKVTSHDGLMILQAAAGNIEI